MVNKGFLVLKRQSDFKNLKDNGSRFFLKPWFLVSFKKNELGYLRCGWTIPKKVGSAVIRNKFKRWCREFFREIPEKSFSYDCNIVFLGKKDKFFFKQLRHEIVDDLLRRTVKKISQLK